MIRLPRSAWTELSGHALEPDVTERAELRHDIHPVAPIHWVRKVSRLSNEEALPPIYPWDELRERIRLVANSGRHDHASFVRHGTTKDNNRVLVTGQNNTVLSEIGRRQAHDLSRHLPSHFDVIACSALARTIETMELAVPKGHRRGVPIIIDPRLNEVSLGTLQGKRRAYIAAFGTGDIDYAPTGGESYRQAGRRAFSFVVDLFDALATMEGGQRVAVVFCHAGILRIVASLVKNTPCASDMFKLNMSNAEHLNLETSRMRLAPFWWSKD